MKKILCVTLTLFLVLTSIAALAKPLTIDDIRAMTGKELSDLLQSYMRSDGKNNGKPLPPAVVEYFAQFGVVIENSATKRAAAGEDGSKIEFGDEDHVGPIVH